MTLQIGSQAPDFTLPTKTDNGIKEIKLSQILGESMVVLLFFPFAFTSVCTDEMCSVSSNLNAYEGLNAQVLGISVDSPFTQEVWALQGDIRFPLLSDFNKAVIQAYDVFYEDFLGLKYVAKRAAYVIQKNGKIAYAWASDDPKQLPDFDVIQATLNKPAHV